ncbi:CopD family protein [Caballeronia sp. LZ062]|uniref:copper resistance D family protein n=1 Tax=unclassified Caballeronia TaxID=2646786 RepID=UPI00285FB1C1|nr:MULTISPECIES: CopD family protein [unclassified Caballeronia]MDR5855754.1 CopD family protein [Caballeronia sp. LZ050]MDR5872459.1 CopD family protein [Caballeronia sp. LZ062]
MNDGFLGVLRLALVALQNISFATLVGALISDRWLVRSTSHWQASVSARLLLAARVACVALLLSTTAAFWTHCALMSESTLAEAGPAVYSMLKETGYGHAWAASALLTCVALGLLFAPASMRGRLMPLTGICLAGIALGRSNTGHSVEAGFFSLPVWADWIHLLAISVWVGLVVATTYVVAPTLFAAGEPDRKNGASFIQSLSDTATIALLVLFATGAYSGWRSVNSPVGFVTSSYGQVLMLKLGLVLVAAALGGHNRFFEMPQLLASLKGGSMRNAAPALKRFSRVLQVESIVLVAVLIAAAVLVSSPLPGTA